MLLLAGTGAFAGEAFAEIQKKIISFQLDNGLRVILYPRGEAPVVSCITYVKTGSVDEHVGITGIAHQLEHLAFKGTALIGTHDYQAERRVLDELDLLYAQIQERQAALLPVSLREGFLALLAKISAGGAGSAPDKIGGALDSLRLKWTKAGVTLTDESLAQLKDLVGRFAGKIQEAEKHVAQNQYANVIERAGGTGLNAFTSNDRTVYHVSLPSNQLEFWAALESDRFMNIVPRQLEKEKQVVLEERRMRTDSSPFGKIYENFISAAFRAHPYGVEVIGHRSDILNYTRGMVRDFYRTHYSPRNTVIAVVGNFESGQARALLDSYFGKIPTAPLPAEPHTVEPAQDGERRVEVGFPAQPILMAGFHIPERRHPDTPALQVLSAVASSGHSSRFYTRLVKARVALSARTWLGPGDRYPRLFVVSAEPSEERSLEQLEEALLGQLERLKTEPPSAEELRRVLTRHRAGVLRGLKSNLNMAIELADYEALSGDWRELFKELESISAVTPERVTAVAAKYLTKSNRTVARLQSTEPPEPPSILGVPPQPPK